MRGEGVGTPQRMSKDGYLPPCVHVFDQTNVGLLLGTNVPKLSGIHQLVIHAFRHGQFCYPLLPFDYLYIF